MRPRPGTAVRVHGASRRRRGRALCGALDGRARASRSGAVEGGTGLACPARVGRGARTRSCPHCRMRDTAGRRRCDGARAPAPPGRPENPELQDAMAEMPSPAPAVGRVRDLVEWLQSGCKARRDWRIGTEHEKFVFASRCLGRAPYDGAAGIRAVLERLAAGGWDPIEEAGRVIALRKGQQSVTLEPGGQLELSGAPLATLHETCEEINDHLYELRAIGDALGLVFVGIGSDPLTSVDDAPVMPKGRYGIMRRYMPTRGALGLDMMMNTATVQVNLDFADEDDMVRKFRTALSLQPLLAGLLANSPFRNGRPTGFLSWRSHAWSDTDPDRCGIPEFVFEHGMGFERWTEYALDVPMYFVHRAGRYLDVAGIPFRRFLEGRLDSLPGERPTLQDWEDHLTTIFTETRLKRFLEMRSADAGPWRRLCALPAIWTGVLYDPAALAEAEELVRGWTPEDRATLFLEAPRQGLALEVGGRPLRAVAADLVAIARNGLKRRARRNAAGDDESGFLDVLATIIDRGITPAEELLAAWRAGGRGAVRRLLVDEAY